MKNGKINPMIEASKEAFQKMYIPPHVYENYTFKFNKNTVKVRRIPKNCSTIIERDDGLSVLKVRVGVNDDIYIQIDHHEPVFISKENGSKILDMLYAARWQKEETVFQKNVKCKNINAKITFTKYRENTFRIHIFSKPEIQTYMLAGVDDLITILEKIEKFLRPKKASLR